MRRSNQITKNILTVGAVLLASMFWASTSKAGTIAIYQGQDDGVGAPPYTNSDAAQASFLAAAGGYGGTVTETYEELATGYYSPISVAGGASIALSAPDYGDGFSGISADTNGVLYGFNTTPGGSQWLGFPGGSATFTFATPTNSFGTFLTGLQTVFTNSEDGLLDFTFTDSDGTVQDLEPTINVDGGAQYFGFTDTATFTSVTITDLSDDAWGIDDTSYNSGPSTGVPEPGTLGLLGLGLLGLVALGGLEKLRLPQAA
jgi:PEP-CTERM motif